MYLKENLADAGFFSIELKVRILSLQFYQKTESTTENVSLPLPYFTIYHYFATHTTLLYILFFKTITFFPKFDFHWYGS